MSEMHGRNLTEDILERVVSAQRAFLVSQDSELALETLVAAVMQLSESRFGYLGELVAGSNGEAVLEGRSVFYDGWSQEQLKHYREIYVNGIPLKDLNETAARVIQQESEVAINDADFLKSARPLPGVKSCSNWMGIPLRPGGKLVGILILADREGGYDPAYMDKLRVLVRSIGYMLVSARERRNRVQTQKYEAYYRELYGSLLKNSLDCIVGMDKAGNICEFNPAAEETFGWKRDEVLGRQLGDVIVPNGMRSAHREGLTRFLRSKEGPVIGQRIEVPALHRSGREFPVELAVICSEIDGEPIFTAHLRDITAARAFKQAVQEARDAAESANNAKTDFVATISHEIRTPINAIMGALGLLDSGQMDSSGRAILSTAQRSADALLDLVNDVLDFARIEAGKLELELVPSNLIDVCDAVVHLLSNRARSSRIRLASVVDVGMSSHVLIDTGKVRQILLNLVGNAIKYSEGGEILVEVGKQSGMLRFSVKDTGPGISEADQKKLFKEFVQLGATRLSGGTGLGLAISRRLVEFMGGKIGVDSAPGKGSTFWFDVPYQPCDKDDEPGLSLKASTILIVGSGFYPDVLARQLRVMGANVRQARDGDKAIEMLRPGSSVNAVIFTLKDSVSSQIEAELRRLVTAGKEVHVPVIVMTATQERDADFFIRHIGAVETLSAPLLNEDVAGALSVAIGTEDAVERTWSIRIKPGDATRKLIRLLLAEDSQANRLVMSELLRRAGFEVDVVGNGQEAVHAVRSLPYDVVLMDVDMPVMDGLQATKEIRKLEGVAGKIPIIALTAHVVTGFAEKVIQNGMDDYLSKPVDKQLMFQKIESWAKARVPHNLGSAAEQSQPAGTQLVDIKALEQLAEDTSKEMVPQIISVFLRELEMREERIRDGIKSQDLSVLAAEGHALKSSASTFGAELIAENARRMDAACRVPDMEEALDAAKAILEFIDPTMKMFREYTSG